MFKKLHFKLSIFCTFISGMILIFMSLVCLFFSETELRAGHFGDFRININMLVNHLENQNIISHNWLAQFQADTHLKIDIRDKNRSLLFEYMADEPLDEELFAFVRQKAVEEQKILKGSVSSDSLLSSHGEFELTYGDVNYYAAAALIPKNNGVLDVAVLCPLAALQKRILYQRLLFAGADILGILLLGIFFWFFTWHMLKPLIINRRKQAEFIASASHELRSPLTVILSSLSAMKYSSPAEREHFSENIETEGRRMGRLIDDMLTLSNADSSHFPIHKTPVELDTLLLSSYEKFEPLAKKKCISMHITLPENGIPPCLCDKERMEQILAILLDNAISYTPPQGKISLSLQSSTGKFTLQVSDNGNGIPDSEKEAVFDRFYRQDKSHKDKSHFGLGLCIAWEIVHMHKGKIWVEDTPGGGSTFVVVLNR